MYDCSCIKKAKGTKKCVIDRETKFNDYKNSFSNNEIILKSQQRFKSKAHNVYTDEINKIALSSNELQNYIIYLWQKCWKSMQNRAIK